jgi:hypothetical protein
VSYLARLRAQTALVVSPGEAPRAVEDRLGAEDVPGGVELTEVVETQVMEAVSPAALRPVADAPGERVPPVSRVFDTPVRPLDAPRVTEPPSASPTPGRPAPALSAAAAPESRDHSGVTIDEVAISRETTLRHVFEWLAQTPPAGPDAPAVDVVAPPASTPPMTPAPPVRTIAVQPPAASRPEPDPAVPRPAPPAIESIALDTFAPPERPPRPRAAEAVLAVEPSQEPYGIEETLTVSIGAINVRIESPAAAPAPLNIRPAAPAAPPTRETRRAAGRLARHYLRP